MQLAVVINRSAGAVKEENSAVSPDRLANLFREVRLHPEIHYVEPTDIESCVRTLAKQRPDAIVVGGGDGTLSTAASVLIETGVPLGILPLGTLNHFAKDLGVSSDPLAAARDLTSSPVRTVDVAEVNGRIFLNNCSLGAYPAAVRRREYLRSARGHSKARAMLYASWDVLRNLRRFRAEIASGGQTISRRTPLLVVSNNHYDGALLSRNLRTRIEEGKLWIYVTRHHQFLPLLRLAATALFGRLDRADGLESWSVTDADVALERSPIQAGIDGEIVTLELPLHFRIRARALRVLAPSTAAS